MESAISSPELLVDAPTDDELMIRLQSGETGAFQQLMDRYWSRLIGFFVRNTRDRDLAEDLAQETFLRVYEESWDYLPLGVFRAWLFRIARNLMIDTVRRQSRDTLLGAHQSSGEDEDWLAQQVASELSTPLDRIQNKEFLVALDEALGGLPEEQRLTFTLHHFADLKLQEIAEILEIPLNTCKSRLRLAREKLGLSLERFQLEPEKSTRLTPP